MTNIAWTTEPVANAAKATAIIAATDMAVEIDELQRELTELKNLHHILGSLGRCSANEMNTKAINETLGQVSTTADSIAYSAEGIRDAIKRAQAAVQSVVNAQ